MFDQLHEPGAKRYNWTIVCYKIRECVESVALQYPTLSHQQIFMATTTADALACQEANLLMSFHCVKILDSLTPDNCDDYSLVIERISKQTARYNQSWQKGTFEIVSWEAPQSESF